MTQPGDHAASGGLIFLARRAAWPLSARLAGRSPGREDGGESQQGLFRELTYVIAAAGNARRAVFRRHAPVVNGRAPVGWQGQAVGGTLEGSIELALSPS